MSRTMHSVDNKHACLSLSGSKIHIQFVKVLEPHLMTALLAICYFPFICFWLVLLFCSARQNADLHSLYLIINIQTQHLISFTCFLLSLGFSSAVYCWIHTSSSVACLPGFYTLPNSLAPRSPFIPVSSSSLTGAADLFIKHMSGICQSPSQAWGDWFFFAYLRLS